MIVLSKDVYMPLGYKSSWFCKVFQNATLDYLVGVNTVIDIDIALELCDTYSSKCRNPLRQSRSEEMVKRTKELMEKLRDTNT